MKILNHYYKLTFAILLTVMANHSSLAQVTDNSGAYSWNRFETGGGGYFTGIDFSNTTPGLMYVRSDVTPLHVMKPGSDRWSFTGDTFWPEKAAGKVGTIYGFGGSTGTAVHPTNNQIVFTAMGNATFNFDGAQGIYKSTDQGATWRQVLSVYVFANDKQESGNQRKCGNPLAIDPQNPDVVYAGTQSNGVYRSVQGGENGTWTKIGSIPNGVKVGTKSIVIDRFSSLTSGRSSVVYASLYNNGVFKSTDGGETFTKMTGSPKCAQWMVQGPDGTIYATNEFNSALGSAGGIWKYNGTSWIEISPAGYPNGSFLGIDVNQLNGNQLAVVSNGFELFKTNNGGVSWEVVRNSSMTQSGDFNYTSQGGRVREIFQAAATVHFDPVENGTLYVCDAFMVWKSENAFSSSGPIDWTPLYKGLNNSIPFVMMAPPQAPSNTVSTLYAGGADGSNFRYDTPGGMPAAFITNLQGFQNYLTGIDFSESQPDIVWLVTNRGGSPSETRVGWHNGGAISNTTAWNVSTPFGPNVAAGGAKIAVSANNPGNAVLVSGNGQKNKVTIDGGLTWIDCRGLPLGVMPNSSAYDLRHPLESDKINGSRFYVFHSRNNGEFYRSDDGGFNWTLISTIPGLGSGEPTSLRYRLAAAPFIEGTVWVALGSDGLYKSSNAGENFTKDSFFSAASLVDFGANKPGNSNPTAYVHGKETATGQWGVYRSDDMGATWVRITPADRPLARPLVIEADRKTFGRVYLSDEAVGISYGETSESLSGVAPAAPDNLNTQIQGTGIMITWTDNSNNETHFKIFRRKSTDTNFSVVGLAGFNALTFTDNSVEPQTEYVYYVEALNETGTGASGQAVITTGPEINAPSGLVARDVGDLRITLTWQDNSSDEDGFTIEYAAGENAFQILGTTSANTTTFTHTNPLERTVYTYRVRATRAGAFSDVSNESSAFVVNRDITLLPVNSDNAHAQILRTVSSNALSTSVASGSIWVGRVATDLIACGVYPFKLPPLEQGVDINKVQFKIKVDLTSAGTNQIIQLWAHPARATPLVLNSDYYDPFYTPPGAQLWTKIGDNFCNASGVSVGTVVTSPPDLDEAFTNFVKTQYAEGAAGQFIFLRINQNSQQQTYRTGFDTRGDADDNQPNGIPQLILSLSADVLNVTMTPASTTVDVGDTVRLSAKVTPSIANPDVIWSSSDTTIAVVDAQGLVSARTEGIVTITATTVDGGKTASSTVTTVPVLGIKVKPDSVTLRVATTRQLGTNPVLPVAWTSSNEAVVAVDDNGLLTALATGSANVTVTTTDSTKTAVCRVNVIEELQANVALGKSAKGSSFFSAAFPASKAVDGDKTNTPSRWISQMGAGMPQSLEVDFGANYNISSIKFWTGGATGGYGFPITSFKFQRWDGSAWQDVITETANTTSAYSGSFQPVVTSKVRLFVVGSTENMVRLYELEVYGVPVRLIDVNLTAPRDTLRIGDSVLLAATLIPANVTNANISWTSSDTTIATVNDEGLVTARACGDVNITVTTDEFNKKSSVLLIVRQPVDSLSLDRSSVVINKGNTASLIASAWPASACDPSVVWRSSDESVVTVGSDGLVTAIGAGSASIIATSNDSGKTDSCAITVVVPVEGVIVSPTSTVIAVNSTEMMVAILSPPDATNKSVVWSSSNPSIATVDENGMVEALSPGTTLIMATTEDGNKTSSAQVVVLHPFNVALNKNAVASSTQNSNFYAGKAVDGDCSHGTSRWLSRISSGLPQWIEVDLGGEHKITGMRMVTDIDELDKFITAFQFQVWNGVAWTSLFAETSNTSVEYHRTFEEVKTTKVRLYVTGSSTNFVSLYELEVYGVGLGTSQSNGSDLPEGDAHIQVFPNPASHALNIKLDTNLHNKGSVTLFNDRMQRVRVSRVKKGEELVIPIDDLPEGVYVLKLESGSSTSTFVVFIEH